MKVITDVRQMQRMAGSLKARGMRIGLVPTMGYLHEGHLSLVRHARVRCDFLVVSIFVNPIQFGPGEDLKSYPRNIRRDKALLAPLKPDVLFTPSPSDVYAKDFSTFIEVRGLSDVLCGRRRPGHFTGVATIVAKLFNMVSPDVAFFGLKDFQQLEVIRKMCADLNFNVEIVGLPTVREKSGLAMSSRNSYLNAEERERASAIYGSLRAARRSVVGGQRDPSKVAGLVKEHIRRNIPRARIDYVEVRDPHGLRKVKRVGRGHLIALAVRVGRARLIDNIII